jgi:hypothetical protein
MKRDEAFLNFLLFFTLWFVCLAFGSHSLVGKANQFLDEDCSTTDE